MFRVRIPIPLLALLLMAPLAALSQAVPGQSQQDPRQSPGWVPPGVVALEQRAAFHTDFTFDRTMLQLAGNMMSDADARNAVAKLNGISVHSYRFAAPGLYDAAALNLIRAQYRAAGWKHLVAAHAAADPFDAGGTDLWISFDHSNVIGMVVLLSDPKDLNLIALNGDLSPLDLLHLRGHFGIPRFAGDRFVATPDDSPAAPSGAAPPPGF